MGDKAPTYRKQGNRANLEPASAQAVQARLARTEAKQLAEVWEYFQQLKTREIVEGESFAELLKIQREQGAEIAALQSEYWRLLRLVVAVQETLVSLELDASRDRKRTAARTLHLSEALKRINDYLNSVHSAELPAIDSRK